MERFLYLPNTKSEYFFCMVCLTNVKERYDNFKLQKKNIPTLSAYDAITPDAKNFYEECSKINFDENLNNQKGRKALWLSNINLFKYFLTTEYKYLVVFQDDAIAPKNLINILDKYYVNHPDFLKVGGVRLGQFASCNLYNKYCIKNILDTIKIYSIDRGLDHYISNIGDKKKNVPYNFNNKLSNLPETITTVNNYISSRSMRIYYDKN